MPEEVIEWEVEVSFIKRISFALWDHHQYPAQKGRGDLTVQFITGVGYVYSSIPIECVTDLLSADNVGGFFEHRVASEYWDQCHRTSGSRQSDPAYGTTGRFSKYRNQSAMREAIWDAKQAAATLGDDSSWLDAKVDRLIQWAGRIAPISPELANRATKLAEEARRRAEFMQKMGWSEARMAKHEKRCKENEEGVPGWFGWIWLTSVVAVICYWSIFADQSSSRASKSHGADIGWQGWLSLFLTIWPLGPFIIARLFTLLRSTYSKHILKLPVFLPREWPSTSPTLPNKTGTNTATALPAPQIPLPSVSSLEQTHVQRPAKHLFVPSALPPVEPPVEQNFDSAEKAVTDDSPAPSPQQTEPLVEVTPEADHAIPNELREPPLEAIEQPGAQGSPDDETAIAPVEKLKTDDESWSQEFRERTQSVSEAPRVRETEQEPVEAPSVQDNEPNEDTAESGYDESSHDELDNARTVEDARPATVQGMLGFIAPTHGNESATKPRRKPTRNESLPNPLNPAPAVEGQRRLITNYEAVRNPKLREMAIQIHGRGCCVCGFNFDDFFGKDLAQGYIEVHHLNNIASGERATDPATDLAPLCANCHAMADRLTLKLESPPRSIAELRKLLLPSSPNQKDEGDDQDSE